MYVCTYMVVWKLSCNICQCYALVKKIRSACDVYDCTFSNHDVKNYLFCCCFV